MKRSLLSAALRSAALIPFTLAACGGATSVATPGDGGSGDGSGSGGSSGGSSGSSSGSSSGGSSSGHGSSSGGTSGSSSGPGGSSGSSSGSGGTCMLASTTPTANPCDLSYPLVGDGSACHPDPTTGQLTLAQCQALCPPTTMYPGGVLGCWVVQGTPSNLTCNYGPCATGRRPERLAPLAVDTRGGGATDPVARYLAEMAWLEAASVPAFERLTRELEAHGAPRRLMDGSRRAAAEEVRHARKMSALATRAGASVGEPSVDTRGVRSLEEIAIENAVEGGVRETFGAAVAAVQAQRAGDARFRKAMKGIAREEARHARLSWDVAEWLDSRLDEDARQRVKAARDRAAEDLLREVAVEPSSALATRFGVPTSGEGRAMVQSLRASLWS